MYRNELFIAIFFGAFITITCFIEYFSFCADNDLLSKIRIIFASFVTIVAILYLWIVDDKRRPLASTWHRIRVGVGAGITVAAICNGPIELYILLVIIGAILGYFGCQWVVKCLDISNKVVRRFNLFTKEIINLIYKLLL